MLTISTFSIAVAMNARGAMELVVALVGLFGILIGVGSTAVATALTRLPPAILWSAVGGAVALSVGVGLAFGMQPAWRAANVDPVIALRAE